MQEFLKKNIVLDYLKVVLILMVLGIHAPLSIGISICGVDILQPFFRMSVPLFFIMSSYFFFGKIHSLNNRNEVYAALKRFIKRNALLYIFWFLLLLPITIHLRWNWWIAPGGIKGAVTFCMNLFFGGTFFASWFLSALLIDVIVIFFASRRLSNGILLLIGIFLYCIAVLFSGFSSVVYKFYPSLESVAIFRAMSLLIPTSFVSAFIWIVIGKIVSENSNFKLKEGTRYYVLAVLFLVYTIEVIVRKSLLGGGGDCYFMLPLVCPVIFILVKDLHLNLPDCKSFRPMSTVFYVFHGSLFYILDLCGFANHSLYKFMLGSVCCCMMYLLLSRLSKVRYLTWVKYSY